MFTNQNQSSGKFWVTAFIVGVLVFLGQFAQSQEKYDPRKNYSSNQCGDFARTGQIGGPCATSVNGKCVSGIETCGSALCKQYGAAKGYEYNQSLPYGQRCAQKQVAERVEVTGKSGRSLCKDAGGNWKEVVTDEVDPDNGETYQSKANSYCECPEGSKVSKLDVLESNKGEKCEKSDASTATSGYAKACVDAQANWVQDEETCYCEGQALHFDRLKSGAKCEKAAAITQPADEDNSAKMARVQRECGLDAMQERIDKCVEGSDKALQACDADAAKSDKNAAQLGSVMKLLGTVQQNKAVQKADPDACGKAAYIGSAASLAIDAMKKTCEEEVKLCKNDCQALKEGESFNNLKNNCIAIFNREFKAPVQTNSRITFQGRLDQENEKLNRYKANAPITEANKFEVGRTMIIEAVTEMEKKAKDNLVKCETDAVDGEKDIAKYLAELLGASIAAGQCKNLASNISARCAAMATQINPIWCQSNPSEVCCGVFTNTITDCNGKDAGTQKCICARTPTATGCTNTTTAGTPPTLGNPGGVSNLAAIGGIKSGNQYKPSGTVGAGNGFEVGSDMDPSKALGATQGSGGSQNPFGTTGGGGGGGGGGVPNSPNDGTGAPPVAADEKGAGLVGGAFNQLKTFADRILGGGGGSGNGRGYGGSGKDGKKNGAVDPNKFKPGLRGLAGGNSPFGPRNKDIWKTMNQQYGMQNHTFISNEK